MITIANDNGHFRSFQKWVHLANVHLFHYADMTRDLAGQMAQIAKALDISHPPDLMAQLVEPRPIGS